MNDSLFFEVLTNLLILAASAQPLTHEELEGGKTEDCSLSGDSIRSRFLNFYASRGHKVLPSASLVPEDPTVLLTIAGMLPFKPIFLGKVRHFNAIALGMSSY